MVGLGGKEVGVDAKNDTGATEFEGIEEGLESLQSHATETHGCGSAENMMKE